MAYSRERPLKKNFSTYILIIAFLIGLSLLLYPPVSNYINQINASYAVVNYDENLEKMSKVEFETILKKAQAYNQSLVGKLPLFITGEPKNQEYAEILDITGNGMMGYVTVEKLGIELPIYHGTANEILVSNAGHLEGSSLPVGGESTHSVMTSHRGLPSAKLFTDLDQMEIGDTFSVTVLDQKCYYEVDQISIVLPEEVEELMIIPGDDRITLFTCTPYAVNTHRLFVRGFRIESPENNIFHVSADAMQIAPTIIAPIIAVPFLIVLFLFLLFNPKYRKKKKK